MIMGDDVTMAVRGEVDVTGWEREISRKHNLSPKVMLRDHGYFCSFDIVHLPEGRTTVVRDVLKAALTFSDPSVKDIDLLKERWISYCDSMADIDDLNVQLYLSRALSARWSLTHSAVDAEAILCLCKAHAACKHSFDQYRAFFADVGTTRYY